MRPDRDSSFRRGFGFGLGFTLGSALVRVIFVLIGFGLLIMFLNALLGKL
jgi:uncharacterized membrane protein YgaE (UPF0421/DUF939 family)